MRAAIVERYGPPEVVRVAETPLPTVGADQVLVRVEAAAVTSADARIRGARFPRGFTPFARLAFGLRRPRRPVLGGAFSGVVEACGNRVQGFAVGDEVCGMTGVALGAHAEHLAVRARRVTHKPSTVSHDDAAAVLFGGSTALHFCERAKIAPGETVLVNGASGAIGTNAVQLACLRGATVTGVASTANLGLVTKLGATHTIDRTTTSLAELDDRFDVVIDTVGNVSIASGRRLLRDGGRLVLCVAGLGETIRARGEVIAGTAPERVEHFDHLLGLIADGSLAVVIDDVHSLDDIVEAHRRVDSGHKVGNLVVHP